ncbi:unnamed protein product [Ilex paraguariensis]|uniref:Uncharacterized protein n=1 Tax=Ilex paraguariensis TaxID=185542 RepID=A0ABC8R3J3_9AQUA
MHETAKGKKSKTNQKEYRKNPEPSKQHNFASQVNQRKGVGKQLNGEKNPVNLEDLEEGLMANVAEFQSPNVGNNARTWNPNSNSNVIIDVDKSCYDTQAKVNTDEARDDEELCPNETPKFSNSNHITEEFSGLHGSKLFKPIQELPSWTSTMDCYYPDATVHLTVQLEFPLAAAAGFYEVSISTA